VEFPGSTHLLVGIIRSKNDAVQIKNNIAKFLSEKLSLSLSAEKTLITHSAKRASFLSFDITVARNTLQQIFKRNFVVLPSDPACPAKEIHMITPLPKIFSVV
jgi:hypothetical protein